MNALITFFEYLLVFGIAAIPMLELLVAIPVGVAMGLNPLAVGLLALAGNLLVTALPCLFWQRLLRSGWQPPARQRGERARRIFARWGLPGLAISGPAVTGQPLAAVIALAFGLAPGKVLRVLAWGLVLWTPPTVLVTLGLWESLVRWWQ